MARTDSDGQVLSMLYVEDEAKSREMLSEILHFHYPDVLLFVSENGEAGIESFNRHKPDIVITDINMPVTNGIRMATEIKSLSPTTEIIVLTAHSDTQYLLQAIEIGINHYILKPIDVERIFKVVDKAIAIIRARRLITEQNKKIRDLNAELVKNAAELELANKELASFDYSVAHDLRSPMVTISGLTQLLLDRHASKLDEEGKSYLRLLNLEVLRISRLVGVMLQFSVNVRKHVDKKWTCLTGIANEIMVILLAQEPRCNVTFCIAEGINGYCDPDLLRIVLENLLGNAWKYSANRGAARIEFGTINTEEDLVYFVRDNGAGFDQQESETLFIPFQRLQCDDSVEGFGVGLATAHRIIQRHGGKLWAEGEKGKGATFYFTL
jgi:two-component system, sensor histidine kinase and response regulator